MSFSSVVTCFCADFESFWTHVLLFFCRIQAFVHIVLWLPFGSSVVFNSLQKKTTRLQLLPHIYKYSPGVLFFFCLFISLKNFACSKLSDSETGVWDMVCAQRDSLYCNDATHPSSSWWQYRNGQVDLIQVSSLQDPHDDDGHAQYNNKWGVVGCNYTSDVVEVGDVDNDNHSFPFTRRCHLPQQPWGKQTAVSWYARAQNGSIHC